MAREAELGSLLRSVDNNTTLTAAHKAYLQLDISNEDKGMVSLMGNAKAAKTNVALDIIFDAMIYHYRVYVVMEPKTGITESLDAEIHLEAAFVANERNLGPFVRQSSSKAAKADYALMVWDIARAERNTGLLPAKVLAQVPDGYPLNQMVFDAARARTAYAKADLAAAQVEVTRIIHIIPNA